MQNKTHWIPIYWAIAGLLPLVLFFLEAGKLILYPATRAPNVHVGVHIALMGLTYGLWVCVPRLIWLTLDHAPKTMRANIIQLSILALALSSVHLFAFALVLRAIYSPPGWGLRHLLNSFGEVWLGNIGFWVLAYGVAAMLIIWVRTTPEKDQRTITRFEVRHNGKMLSILFSDIYWIKAAGNYAELYTQHGTYTVRQTLKQVKSNLPEPMFISSHRSAIVNSQHVIAISPDGENGSYKILLRDDHTAPLSRRNLTPFKDLLKTAP